MKGNAQPAASECSAIDHAYLESLCASARRPSAFFADLAATFAAAVPARLEAIRAAIGAGNPNDVWTGAYGLVRACAGIGANGMARLGWELAAAADDGDTARMTWVVDRFEAGLPATLRALDAESEALALAS